MARICGLCEQPLAVAEGSVQQAGDVWHVRCFNAAENERRAYQQERDDCEGFTWREKSEHANVRKPSRSITVALYPISKQVA